MVIAFLPARCLIFVCRREAQLFYGASGKNICGYRQYMHNSNSSTTNDMRAVVFDAVPTRKEIPSQMSLGDSKDCPAELLPWIHQISRLNLWQEAMHFLKSSRPESVFSLSQEKSSETGLITNSCSSTRVICGLLISAFLYYGHGERAFLLWRNSSTVFNFAPTPMLMMKLAVYAILVDGQVQEALDLASIATLQTDCMSTSEGSILECFGLWITFYVAFLTSRKSILQGGGFKIDDSAEQALLKLSRLAWGPSTDDAGNFSAKRLQLALHAVLLLVSHEGGKELLQRITSLLPDDTCTVHCLQQVASFLTPNLVESKPHELFSPNTFIFLLEHLFPLPLDYYLKDDTPVFSGLLVYQCFFNESNEAWLGEKKKNVSSPSSVVRPTVGSVLLKRLHEYCLLRLFIYSIVSYDIDRTNSSLMVHVMMTPVGSDTSKKVSQSLGQDLLSIVEGAFKHKFRIERHFLLTLGYISRVLAPFLSHGVQKHQDGPQLPESSVLVNEDFYIQLLTSLVSVVHGADVKAWQRLVERVTITIVKRAEVGLEDVLPLSLRMQLHLRWWLPRLLALTDTARERVLFVKLKKPFFSESTKEWDSIAYGILWDINEKGTYRRETKKFDWAQCNSDLTRKEQNKTFNCTTNELYMTCNPQRLLVRRFVRWEWFFKGIWEFVHEGNMARHHTLWDSLLTFCSGTLESCRLFHRNDIAIDLMDILFFPAEPFLVSNPVGNEASCINCEKTVSGGISGSTSRTLGLLLFAGVMDNAACTTTSCKALQWRFFDEMFRWLLAFQAWERLREVMLYWPLRSLHSTKRYFLSLQWYLEDLNRKTSKGKVLGGSEQKRVRDLFEWYEGISCTDASLRTPKILLPLARALRRAKLLDCLRTLLRNTFNDLHNKFHRPWRSSTLRQVEDGLILLFDQYNVDLACMEIHNAADITVEVPHSIYENAQTTIAAFAEVYILALWENNCFSEVKTILLKPVSDNRYSKDTQATSLVSSPPFGTPLNSCPENAKEIVSLFSSDSLVFLLPLAEREAMRLLLLLTLAQQSNESTLSALFRQLPRSKADPGLVITYIERLLAQEPHLFAPVAVAARKVAAKAVRLSEACTAIALQYRNNEGQKNVTDLKNEKEAPVRNMKDLNRCIDSCNWEAALRAIPHVIADPLHVARKALLACEKSPKGAAWQGAMNIFIHSKRTWEEHQWQDAKKSPSSMVEIQELGRIMTLLANAKRWHEAIQVFESLTPSAVDGYIFSQTSYALYTGGHPELGVDLWAMWRATVGDAAEPTPQMCGHFLRCGVAGDTAMADAACQMLKEGVTKMATLREEKKHVPGTVLPLPLEREERSIIALLRDRWRESWQEALHLALISGRSPIIQAVAWQTPSNYHLYEAFMQDAARKGRCLSSEERSALAGHLDITTALTTGRSTAYASKDRAVRVLQEILGEDDDNSDNGE